MRTTNKYLTALILNTAAFVCGCVGIIFRLAQNAADFFLYYTQISNVAAVVSSALYIAFRGKTGGRAAAVTRALRYLSACMLTMTFLVVMCIFVPFGGDADRTRLLGSVNGIMHHAVCPVLSVVSYVFFEKGYDRRHPEVLPIAATAVYAAVIYALNILRLAPAPYPFFAVYEHPVWETVLWFLGLMVMIAAIAAAVKTANRRFGDG